MMRVILWLITIPLSLQACRNTENSASPYAFSELFAVQSRIPLQYTDSSIIVTVGGNISFCGDRILVGDSQGRQVLMFSMEGKFLRRIGKSGDGQGQYGDPSRVCITSTGNIFVYDANNNSVLFYDSAATFLCRIALRAMSINQWGVSNERIITIGSALGQEISALGYYWSECDTTYIGELVDNYDFPKYHHIMHGQYHIPVDDRGNFYLLDEATFRLTKVSRSGQLLETSNDQPSGFKGPDHDLIDRNNMEEAQLAAEKAHSVLGFGYASGFLFVVWWDHKQCFIEIYDKNLMCKATHVVLPDILYPFLYSDGTYLYFLNRRRKTNESWALQNPTLIRYSPCTDAILQKLKGKQTQ